MMVFKEGEDNPPGNHYSYLAATLESLAQFHFSAILFGAYCGCRHIRALLRFDFALLCIKLTVKIKDTCF